MAQAPDTAAFGHPDPLWLSRIFPAPRATVFKAWSSAEHVRRWFCPHGFAVPEARVEMRVGGPFDVCMRGPDGTDYWTRGTFAEVSPVDRLTLDLYGADAAGRRLFGAFTEVSFADDPAGTRMEVVQTYTVLDPDAARMVKGAPEGWAQTLDKLAAEVTRIVGGGTPARAVVHGTFHLERTYDVPAERVFRALSDEAAKRKWFTGAEGTWQLIERHMDFRVGGSERLKGRWQSGVVSTFDAVYHDIVANERIVYAYEMHLDDRKISVSLTTMQFRADGAQRTTLLVTEQGAFLDGYDDAGAREQGTGVLLDRLSASLHG